jgi:hypothetical protein
VPHSTAQCAGFDREPVVELGDRAAERIQLGREGGKAIGLVPAQVRYAGNPARTPGKRSECDHGGCEFTALAQVKNYTGQLRAAANPCAAVDSEDASLVGGRRTE